ncbi:MAG: NPCBM/NEW2 domain-containing protein [Sedimentisphaeraceae bacterium JB056]
MKLLVKLSLLIVAFCFFLISETAANQPQKAGIKHGDILMRSLRVWPKDENDSRDTLKTAKEFKVDKIVWIYENTPEFNQKVRKAGIGIGTTMSDNARESWFGKLSESQASEFINKYTIRNLKGEQVIPKHFTHFSNGYTAHFVPDMTIEKWANVYIDYLTGLYNTGIETIHRDDPASTAWSPRCGGTFTDSAVEYFRNYLEDNYDIKQLKQWGVDDIKTFNVREHFLAMNAPTDNSLWQWRESPLMRIYLDALQKANVDFFIKVRSEVEKATGMSIPWSRNGVGAFDEIDKAFDFRIGEYQRHHSQPQTMLKMSRYAADAGKMQATISMVDGKWNEHPEEFVSETRKHIATAYAVGMIPLVPWCMYMHQAPRYYGEVEDFGDLYHFVAANKELFNGHKLTCANGIDTLANLYSWKPNKELIYPENSTRNIFNISKENVFAFLRENKDTGSKVIHLIDWNNKNESFTFSFSPEAIVDTNAATLTILQYGSKNITIDNYTGGDINMAAISPWALVTVEPAKSTKTASPVILSPSRRITAQGTELIIDVEDNCNVFYKINDGDFKKYSTNNKPVINQNGTIQAYAVKKSDASKSDIVTVNFETFIDRSVCESVIASARPAARLEKSFKKIRGEMKVNESFLANDIYVGGEKIKRAVATQGSALITCKTDPSWKYFTVKAAVDDAEDRRPAVRFQVMFDDKMAYETPILNPSKLIIADQDRKVFDIALEIPKGTSNIRLVSFPCGFFHDQNNVIWIEPIAYK